MFGILRSDARWYAGTADREPQFGEKAAPFRSEPEAEQRAAALTERGHSVEIIPIVAE
jgi:hypothetical protein